MSELCGSAFNFAAAFAAALLGAWALRKLAGGSLENGAVCGTEISGGKFFFWILCYLLALLLVPVALRIANSSFFCRECVPPLEKELPGSHMASICDAICHIIMALLACAMARAGHIFRGECGNWRPFHGALKSAACNFIPLLVIVVIFSITWENLIDCLISAGIPVSTSKQEIMEIFLHTTDAVDLVIFSLTAICIVPISEEVVFRAFIYKFLKTRTNGAVACVATAFIFAHLHFNAAAFFPLFALSICLSMIYERSGDIRELVLLHAFFNCASILRLHPATIFQ